MKLAWILLALCLAACAPATDEPDFTLYLVRHAEKMAGGDDPELDGAGHTRAARLAGWLSDREIEVVWSTNFRRTLQTAFPLQVSLGVPIERYDASDLAAFADRLRTAGQDALVVGHSNTTPQLAALLCACEVADMDDVEYDRMLVIDMRDGQGSLTTLNQADLFAE